MALEKDSTIFYCSFRGSAMRFFQAANLVLGREWGVEWRAISIHRATVTRDGTTIEEVESCHRDTLQLIVAETNRQYRDWQNKQKQRREREETTRRQHRNRIEDASKRIKFD
jgi:hypothetical protein